MRITIPLLALATTTLTLAMPASIFKQLNADTMASDACKLPEPTNNCAGFLMKDVIIAYGNANQTDKDLIIKAVKESGANVLFDYHTYGFSGLVPESVLNLIKAHGATFGLKTYDNACYEIPWCGEAPC
ncbi:hypothetical protein K491DRAFT_159405 [Lophiostoma macrostomum CBS 122681]|uniref:Uncharacterized protein n=1 Tax=Lophiostoma macrostomum CBS 122681 TaxID=1314788 RepID=A0A6A6SUM7_9PLEO|nr:hypothetical protein K491DRAFT_159405 [Lophiostoma macrostomum CBS 122681]